MCEGDDIRASSYGLSPGQVQQVFTQRGVVIHLHVKKQHTVGGWGMVNVYISLQNTFNLRGAVTEKYIMRTATNGGLFSLLRNTYL